MGIFNEPKQLAMLLSCFKVPEQYRQLSPITAAKWLQNGEKELGDAQEVMKRVDLKKFMWDGFRDILSINEDIENIIKWGKSDPETLQIGFSDARIIAKFTHDEQITLVNAMWDYGKPFGYELLRRIRAHYKVHPDKTLNDAIKNIIKLDRPNKILISIFISGLDEKIYNELVRKSQEKSIGLDDLTKQIMAKQLPKNSINSVKTRQNFIRISFSENGKKEFDKLARLKSISKNNIINKIFEEELS